MQTRKIAIPANHALCSGQGCHISQDICLFPGPADSTYIDRNLVYLGKVSTALWDIFFLSEIKRQIQSL